ncbi:hypothetical protein ACFYY8_17650 [Streptosporangium sp. NPDC001559]|uniref:hypothetical protein n=1 Tax=Streptosporangium sp. NPDC001559 TaxID=3366187 RepID=UPI0036E204D2
MKAARQAPLDAAANVDIVLGMLGELQDILGEGRRLSHGPFLGLSQFPQGFAHTWKALGGAGSDRPDQGGAPSGNPAKT